MRARGNYDNGCLLQWTLAKPDSLGPEPIQICEIFGLVKATAATCVIVTAPYPWDPCLCCTFTEHTTLLPNDLLALS